METMPVDGLTLYFETEDREAAELIGHACKRSIQLMEDHWGLRTPEDCRVYVMTSWLPTVFHSAPWQWRILLAILMPLWAFRAKRLWAFAGGWAQSFGKRRTVSIKPPRILQLADWSTGDRIFVREDTIEEKVQHVTCHELVHAFTDHLKLPTWLHEGVAMVTVDRFCGKPTIQASTLDTLERRSTDTSPGGYRSVRTGDKDGWVYLYARGYWLTRYLEDAQPGLLKSLLQQRQRHAELENRVATALGIDYEEFWSQIDEILVSHFRQEQKL